MRVYQINSKLKKIYYDIDFTGVKNEVDLVKRVRKYKDFFIKDNSYGVYVEKIPKKIWKYNNLTIIIDIANNETRYFSDLCNLSGVKFR